MWGWFLPEQQRTVLGAPGRSLFSLGQLWADSAGRRFLGTKRQSENKDQHDVTESQCAKKWKQALVSYCEVIIVCPIGKRKEPELDPNKHTPLLLGKEAKSIQRERKSIGFCCCCCLCFNSARATVLVASMTLHLPSPLLQLPTQRR